MKLAVLGTLLFFVTAVSAQGRLVVGVPEECNARSRHMQLNGHNYAFSWIDAPNRDFTWFEGRNFCRRKCMDLVSLENPEENQRVKEVIGSARPKVKYIWTSGRKCDFGDCDADDQFPNEWFWSGSGVRMPPSNQQNHPNNDWSHTGGLRQPQPDNREQRSGGASESCMAILNDFYSDGIKWHDVACNHRKPVICEDSDQLLRFAAAGGRQPAQQQPQQRPQFRPQQRPQFRPQQRPQQFFRRPANNRFRTGRGRFQQNRFRGRFRQG